MCLDIYINLWGWWRWKGLLLSMWPINPLESYYEQGRILYNDDIMIVITLWWSLGSFYSSTQLARTSAHLLFSTTVPIRCFPHSKSLISSQRPYFFLSLQSHTQYSPLMSFHNHFNSHLLFTPYQAISFPTSMNTNQISTILSPFCIDNLIHSIDFFLDLLFLIVP